MRRLTCRLIADGFDTSRGRGGSSSSSGSSGSGFDECAPFIAIRVHALHACVCVVMIDVTVLGMNDLVSLTRFKRSAQLAARVVAALVSLPICYCCVRLTQ